MKAEEFLNFFKSFQDDMEFSAKVEKAFYEKLTGELVELVFSCWPELKHFRGQLTEALMNQAKCCSKETMEAFCHVEYYVFRGELPAKSPRKIPQPLTSADGEREFQEFMDAYPNMDPEECRQVFWPDFELEVRSDYFLHQVHRQMKEGLTTFYLENILAMEAEHLLLLDDLLFTMVVFEFAEAVYILKDKTLEEQL